MKKIYALLLMLAFAFTLSACGPNSDYYDLGSKNFYYYKDKPLIVDPYQFIRDNNKWLDISQSRSKKPENYYDVEVEWRKEEESGNFKDLELVNNMIKFDDPYKKVGNNQAYVFKVHFLEQDAENPEDTMFNYYGVFSFIKSPANAETYEEDAKVNDTYTLLSNVVEYDPSDDKPYTPSELAGLYDVTYDVTLDDEDVTVTDGKVTFDETGTYHVNIELAAKVDESESDGESSASGAGGAADRMILNIEYTITVTE